jgi:hypothetical protein
MKRRLILFLLIFLTFGILPAGCPHLVDSDTARRQVGNIDDQRSRMIEAVADLDARLAVMPADDLGRAAIETQRKAVVVHLRELDDLLARRVRDAEISEQAKPVVDTVTGVASGLPYGEVIVGLLGAGLFAWKKIDADRQRKKTVVLEEETERLAKTTRQVVQGVDAAFPVLTEQQKMALSATQDEDVRATVAGIKAAKKPAPLLALTPIGVGALKI